MRVSCKTIIFIILTVFTVQFAQARDHLIFSVSEDLPMGNENEILRRNYYVNIGSNQGVTKGTTLNVYRIVSKLNPYDNKRRINYKVIIGKLEVIHSEDESAIGTIKELNNKINDPLFEINNLMIGDHVAVAIK